MHKKNFLYLLQLFFIIILSLVSFNLSAAEKYYKTSWGNQEFPTLEAAISYIKSKNNAFALHMTQEEELWLDDTTKQIVYGIAPQPYILINDFDEFSLRGEETGHLSSIGTHPSLESLFDALTQHFVELYEGECPVPTILIEPADGFSSEDGTYAYGLSRDDPNDLYNDKTIGQSAGYKLYGVKDDCSRSTYPYNITAQKEGRTYRCDKDMRLYTEPNRDTLKPYTLEEYDNSICWTYQKVRITGYNLESVCSCEEDLVNGQCVARTDFEYDFNNDNPEKLFTSPNNQGGYCEAEVTSDNCAADAANTPSAETGNPINCASGVKRQTEVDYSSSVGGLSFRRTYSSTPISQNTLERLYAQDGQTIPGNVQVVGGNAQVDKSYHQWRVEGLPVLNLDNRYPGLTIARLALPSGSEINFLQRDSETSWTQQYQKNGTLINDGTGYRYTSQSGTVYQFDAQGRLTSKTYRNGQSHSMSYPSSNHAVITDSFNRSIELFFEDIPQSLTSSNRIITKLIDPAGNEYRYQHDNAGYITKVIYPDTTPSDWTDNPYKEYLYEDRTDTKVLIGIMDENGERYATYDYDNKNRAVLSEHAGGAIKTTLDYLDDTATDQSLVRFYRDDVNYREAVYHHALLNGSDKVTKLEQLPCLGCTVGDYTYDYDANGFLSQATSPEGDITQFTYNLRGLLESRTEAFGTSEERTVTTTWHSQYKLPLTVDEPQRLTTYSYDANGNLLSRSVKDKATNETRSVSYTYNSVGQVLTVDGPRTDVSDITTYEYDTSGNLTKITNALGHETLITSHDAHGKPLSVTDPNGTVTTLTYHPRGWLTSITTDGATTSYDYDNAGQLIAVTMANGIVLNYEYDAAHRLVAIADANGNRIEYTLDNYGNRTRTEIKDSSGVIQSYAEQVFNDLGQLKQSLGANNQINEFDYDSEGKPVQSEDALDNPTSQQFDALDRLQKVVDPALGETEFGYDNQDRLTSVTDATGKTTSYQYNAFGDLLSMTSPDTGTSTITYDSAGNVLTATDARNITASYSYDALNRVTSIDYPGTVEDITFTYDSTANGNHGVGRLTQVTDESGSTSYEYDTKGQLIGETRIINGLSFTTGYDYDAAGLITQVTYPSGRTVDYQRNNLGQVIAATTTANGQTQTLASNISYLPFGPLTSMTYGNGKVLTQSFDQDYRLTSKHTTGLQQLNYGYTLRNNINSISDLMDSTKNQAFSYDALGRLTDASGNYGTQSYTFDPIGNRLSKTQDDVTQYYHYDDESHQLGSVASLYQVNEYDYDAIGNVISKDNGFQQISFSYNQAGRLATASKTGMNATYSYNAQGQRVKKVVELIERKGTLTTTTFYHYDQAGQLIAETDGQGNLLKEYLYLDGQRLATVDNGNLYYIHTDHLGSPLALTDNNGTVQWKGSYDPYGNVTIEVNNLDQNQRFPGQYADEETGLHYNYFRDYDPEIGRYIQSDPIGLNGGINTYGYVGGNPVNFVDLNGLEITWSGSMETFSVGELGGGMKAYFFLTSSCGSDGNKWHVKITASGIGSTLGFPFSASASQIKLTDPGTNIAHPTRLEGPFVHAGGSAGVLLGASLSLTQLGWAQSKGWNVFAGLDISTYDFIGNDAEITWAKKRECSCSNEDK